MQFFKKLSLLIALSTLIGCADVELGNMFHDKREVVASLTPGMTQQEILHHLGYPANRATFDGNVERWYYPSIEQIIVLQNGRLTALEVDHESKARNYEIEKAKAGATQLHISNTNNVSNTSAPNQSHKCVGDNVHGYYEQGGGCNFHGCWPAGGSCNFWGCSATSECTIHECKDKIPSFRCER
jgi:outer membrane protein assembly factor BamE (lipoprotein component of BamABCDE complex)